MSAVPAAPQQPAPKSPRTTQVRLESRRTQLEVDEQPPPDEPIVVLAR